jgi:hypothetical protein
MQTNVKPKAPDDRRDFVVIPSDQVRVAPSDAEITDLLRAAARQHSEAGAHAAPDPSVPVPAVDTTFRATAVNDDAPARGQTFGRRLMRAVAALLLAMGIGAAALTWQTFGYAAKKVLLTWAPKWAIVASLPLEKLGLAPESKPSDDAADAPPAQAAAPAQTNTADSGAPANAAANASTPSADSTQQLQSMGHDLANANQEIEALKASIAELKASQQQMSRDLAKAASDRVAEQAARAKAAAARKPAPPPYSPTTTAAAPAPAYRPSPSAYSAQAAVPQPSPQATAQPYVPPPPMQLRPQADPGLPSTAMRPPMPVQ